MPEEEELKRLIEKVYESVQFAKIQTYANELEKRIAFLEEIGVEQEPEPNEILWPSLVREDE